MDGSIFGGGGGGSLVNQLTQGGWGPSFQSNNLSPQAQFDLANTGLNNQYRQLSNENALGQANLAFQKDAFGRNLAQQNQLTRLGYQTQLEQTKMPLQYQQGRFNKVFPFYENLFKQFGGTLGGKGQAVGGQSAAPPPITAAPIYNPQQTQEAINAGRAQNDQATATQIHSMQQQLGGQGYGSNSPLAALLTSTYQGQNQANNAQMAQQLGFNSAAANSQQLLAGQQAQSDQWNQAQQQDIARRQLHYGTLVSLLGGLSGMV